MVTPKLPFFIWRSFGDVIPEFRGIGTRHLLLSGEGDQEGQGHNNDYHIQYFFHCTPLKGKSENDYSWRKKILQERRKMIRFYSRYWKVSIDNTILAVIVNPRKKIDFIVTIEKRWR
jgi:hypothetical protein